MSLSCREQVLEQPLSYDCRPLVVSSGTGMLAVRRNITDEHTKRRLSYYRDISLWSVNVSLVTCFELWTHKLRFPLRNFPSSVRNRPKPTEASRSNAIIHRLALLTLINLQAGRQQYFRPADVMAQQAVSFDDIIQEGTYSPNYPRDAQLTLARTPQKSSREASSRNLWQEGQI